MANIIKRILNKDAWTMYFAMRGKYDKLPDDEYLKKLYKAIFHKELDLDDPKTFSEKLQWLKLCDRRPVYNRMVDKAEAKVFAAERIGEEYIIPTYGVWNSPDEVDFSVLTEPYVIKSTKDSGSAVICPDVTKADPSEVLSKLTAKSERDYYLIWREWPYKDVPSRIIAEKYMVDSSDGELRDYKFFTFGGEPKYLYIASGRGRTGETVADFFDMDFNHVDLKIDHENAATPPHPPKNFELMKTLAAKLAAGTPELRVDFYEVDGRVYFGEMTFFHCAGLYPFKTPEWDRKLGDLITLPEKTV